jgi:hypothetical protein
MKRTVFLLLAGFALGTTFLSATPRKFARQSAAPPTPAATPNPNCLPDSLCPDWASRYDGAALYDHAFDIVANADGTRLYVTGASTSTAGAQDYLTVAYNAQTGAQLWQARYDGPGNGNDSPAGMSALGSAIVISKDGARVFVTGHSPDANGKNEYATIAYSTADGTQLWVSRYSAPRESQANALVLSGDGQRLYVTGYSALAVAPPPAPGVDNYDFVTVAYDTANGDERWVARYEGPAAFWDIPYAMAVGDVRQPDGSKHEQVFVTGRSNGASADNANVDFATVAYDGNSGAQLWVARYDAPAHDRDLAYAVGVSPNGSAIFVTGDSVGNGTTSDYATVSYDALTGVQRWAARYEKSDLDIALALAVSPKGDRVAVTGFSVNDGAATAIDRSVATILYNTETGAQVWEARHGEVDGAAASRVSFSQNARQLYVGGLENGNVIGIGVGGIGGQVGHAPALTVAYDAVAGSELWATHYSGPAGDEGNSGLVVSPDGTHVFVTGGGQSQGADFATVSYSTGAAASGPVSLTKVVSSKVHGDAGTFEIKLPQAEVVLSPGIECRSGGANGEYTIIFTFANPLTAVVDATTSCGIVSSGAIDSNDAHRYIVNLTGVTCNAVDMHVSLMNVFDSAGNVSADVSALFGLLIGDTNADGAVNSGDIAQTKSESGHTVSEANFREDPNTDGSLNSGDIALVKSKSGTALPQ